ncbi:MAG TPA: hypothetical protein VK102_11585 [Sphingobacterium sp.]|nr:hypothetical protein [Sphingobacterium sp.]
MSENQEVVTRKEIKELKKSLRSNKRSIIFTVIASILMMIASVTVGKANIKEVVEKLSHFNLNLILGGMLAAILSSTYYKTEQNKKKKYKAMYSSNLIISCIITIPISLITSLSQLKGVGVFMLVLQIIIFLLIVFKLNQFLMSIWEN